VFLPRLDQVRQRSLQGVIRPQDININHRLERIRRELVDRRQEVAGSTRAASMELWLASPGGYRKTPLPTYITKSMPPSSLAHRSAVLCKSSGLRTSTAPIPMTLAPGRAVAMSLAAVSVFSTFRPTMHASAPRWTRARTCALHMVPAPPVQKTTLFAGRG
jgi:hypothetical protein